MGCCGSFQQDSTVNPEITEQVGFFHKPKNITLRFLMLGGGESGKSTILRQIRRLQGSPIDQAELTVSKAYLKQNIIECMRTLAIQSEMLATVYNFDTSVSTDLLLIRDRVAKLNDKGEFTKEMLDDFHKLFNDKGIKKTLEYRDMYYIMDNVDYVLSKMHCIIDDDDIPTIEDYIHCRHRTAGIYRVGFTMCDEKNDIEELYEFIDVGGQRSERPKWTKILNEQLAAVIYVAALSAYNQLLFEDRRVNKLQEEIALFGKIINIPQFLECHTILFLNKSDLFKQKILKHSIKETFPDYHGDDKNLEVIIGFITKKFCEQKKDITVHKTIYVHVTCATDTECIKNMFSSIRDIVLSRDLITCGFM